MEIVAALLGALITALIAYPLGKHQVRQQVLYEKRAEIVTNLRNSLHELRWDYVRFTCISEHRDKDWPTRNEQADSIGEKLEDVEQYYTEHMVWLEKRTRDKFESASESYEKIGLYQQ